MLENIYTELNILTIIFSIGYLLFIVVSARKQDNLVIIINCKIFISVIIYILFLIRTILAIILTRPVSIIANVILCAVVWAFNTIIIYLNLKVVKNLYSINKNHYIFIPNNEDEDEEEKKSRKKKKRKKKKNYPNK